MLPLKEATIEISEYRRTFSTNNIGIIIWWVDLLLSSPPGLGNMNTKQSRTKSVIFMAPASCPSTQITPAMRDFKCLQIPPEKRFMKADAQILKRWLGIALFILSFAFYGFLLLVPLTPFSAEGKIAFSAAVVVLAESSFWLSVILLGREAIAKYRRVDWRTRLAGFLKRI